LMDNAGHRIHAATHLENCISRKSCHPLVDTRLAAVKVDGLARKGGKASTRTLVFQPLIGVRTHYR
jgi:hypothetical protein